MPGIDFGQLRARVSLRDVLGLLDFRPVRCERNQLRGLCPLRCSSSEPAFVAYLESQRYYCFSCRRSGDALDLWVAVQGPGVYEAAWDLCQRLGIEVPLLPRRRPPRAP